ITVTGSNLYSFYCATTGAVANFDYNLHFSNDTDHVYIDGAARTMAGMQALNYGLNSVEGNPQFASLLDLHILLGTLANDAGTALGVAYDVDGDFRSITTP